MKLVPLPTTISPSARFCLCVVVLLLLMVVVCGSSSGDVCVYVCAYEKIYLLLYYTGYIIINFVLVRQVNYMPSVSALWICMPYAAIHSPQVCFIRLLILPNRHKNSVLLNTVKLSWRSSVCLLDQKKNYIQFWHIQHMEFHSITRQNKNSTTAVHTPNYTKCSRFEDCSNLLHSK